MTHFSYKDIDFKDIEEVSSIVQYWLSKIERLNRHAQMSIEFPKESATEWRHSGLGAMREQILEEVIDVLNLALHVHFQKINQPYSFKKRKFYVPIQQLMAEGATDIFKTYPTWQAHLTELDKVIQKLDEANVYHKQQEKLTEKLVSLLGDFNIYCPIIQARQAA